MSFVSEYAKQEEKERLMEYLNEKYSMHCINGKLDKANKIKTY